MRAAQLALLGLVTGSFLLLGTLGFALIRRVEGFLNIAHAELMSVSAFATWYLSDQAGWPFPLAAAAAVVLVAVAGLLLARLLYDPIKHLGPAVLLITSVGVVFLLHGITEAVVGTGIRNFPLAVPGSVIVGPFRLSHYQLVVIALAGFTSVGLALFLNRTRTGTAIRAMAINRELAASRGVDIAAASRATWLVASGLAGLAGVALGMLGTLTSDIAFGQILLILSVAILAGLGSLYAVIVAALVVGVAMDLSVLWLPGGYRPMIAFLMVILVLLVRPSGLAGEEAR